MKYTQEEQMELIQQLATICQELGWIVGVPSTPDNQDVTVPGLIVGTQEFVYQIVSNYYGPDVNEHVEAFTADANEDIQETLIEDKNEAVPQLPNPNKKKTQLH